ncbi:hypothetical protein NRB20_61090 [Nocardia sp. RB20]|uniref:Uncharacterized protein n=1 Tax=Nocardia macrotermitis TaxID=2585198 RepID=A0A7K0DB13_9NOCA|nr:hypothetical protein [Nocardia macrotermitis]
MWSPRGIHRLSTELPTALGRNLCTGHSQGLVHRLHRRIHPRGLTCADDLFGLWIPRGIHVRSSRNPPVLHGMVHMCAQPGDHDGRTRGWLEDGPGTDSRRPQRLSVHPRVTRSTSPCRHAFPAGDSAGVHRFHSAYYYFSSSSRDLSFKTGCVETRLGTDRHEGASSPTRIDEQGEERNSPEPEHRANPPSRARMRIAHPTHREGWFSR